MPVVNLGLSGVAAIHYGKILARLKPTARADAAFIFLGTNDIARRLRPESQAAQSRFEDRFTGVLHDLGHFAGRLVYVPLMPALDDLRAANWLDIGRATQFRLIARKACLSNGCQPVDLDGIKVGLADDGVHIAHADRIAGAALHQLVEAELCREPGASSTPAGAQSRLGQGGTP